MSWVNVIFVIYQIIAIMAVIHVVMDNRQPAKTMAWALVIWFVPVAGSSLPSSTTCAYLRSTNPSSTSSSTRISPFPSRIII